jgi:vesicle coat complex subunit
MQLIRLTILYRYASEVDVDFVRKSVRAIGKCAIKIDIAAEKCVQLLVELIQTKVTYVVQEAVVVIRVRVARRLYSCSLAYFCFKRTFLESFPIAMKV